MGDMRGFRGGERRGRGIASPLEMIEGILQDDLDAAIDTLIGATTATAHEIKWDEGTDFYDTRQEFTITNRSIDLAIVARTYVICARLNGEWRIIWADCGPEDFSGSASSIESSFGVLPGEEAAEGGMGGGGMGDGGMGG